MVHILFQRMEHPGTATAARIDAAPPTIEPPYPPVEPPVASATFPDPRALRGTEVVAISRTLSPGLVLAAYRLGIFPWPVSQGVVPWVAPEQRAIFSLADEPRWPRSLRKTLRRGEFDVTFDRAFGSVIHGCGTARDGATWITPDVVRTYETLHRLGWAHSVEVWDRTDERELVGGLYGLAIGSAFAGESMFHTRTDASKVAFVALVDRLRERGFALLDAQVPTEHLMSLGCVAVERADFMARLEAARGQSARFR